MNRTPQRIVCLSAEAADWLWRIGAWQRVAGVTAFFNAPPEAPARPRVSGFSSANLEQIAKLKPDLVITFSDVQAKLAAELMQRGLTVLATNQRTLAEVEATLALLGRIVDCEPAAEALLAEFRERLAPVPCRARPRVYFEEWNDPLVSGIGWVGELIERAGGQDVFPRCGSAGRRRNVWCRRRRFAPPGRKSFSPHGAASRCKWRRSPRAPAGLTLPPCEPAACTKFPVKTSCNRASGWSTDFNRSNNIWRPPDEPGAA